MTSHQVNRAVDMLAEAYCKHSETIDLDHAQHDKSCQERQSDANHARLHDTLRLISFAVETLTGEPITNQLRVKWYYYQNDTYGNIDEPEEDHPDAKY